MNKILRSPFDIVAQELDVKADTLNEDCCMGEHPNWDSRNHLSIIVALETNYGISIPDNEIMKYDNMRAIIGLYKKLSNGNNISSFFQRIKKNLKRSKIGKVFFLN